MTGQRDYAFDAFKGFAIITVIAIHSANSGWGWYGKEAGAWNYYFTLIMSKAYAYAVPLFFFVAGYFVANHKELINGDVIQFLNDRLQRLAIPYLVFSIAISFLIHRSFNIQTLIYKLLLGQMQGPYYFIVILLSLTLVTPLLFWLLEKHYGLTAVLSVNALSLLVTYFLILTLDGGLIWWKASLPFTNWVGFYYLGMVLSRNEKRRGPRPLIPFKATLVSVMFALCLSLSETALLTLFFGKSIGLLTITPFATLYAIVVICYFMSLKDIVSIWPGFLIYVGQRSFGIFLVHELFRSRLSDFFSTNALLFSLQPVLQVLVIVITLVVCVAIINSFRFLMGRNLAARLFGF